MRCRRIVVLAMLVLASGSGSAQYLAHFTSGPLAGSGSGRAVSPIADVDGDGVPDYLVGEPMPAGGAVRLISGATHLVLHAFIGPAGSAFGHAVGGLGDVNGDGVPDLVVGAPSDSTNGALAGAVIVFSGADYAVIHTFFGAAPGDRFGWDVSRAGDLDGDGRDDVLVGAPLADSSSGVDCGRVTVHSGVDGVILHSLEGAMAASALGAAVRWLDDVDGDGVTDFLVGSPGAPVVTGVAPTTASSASFVSRADVVSGATGLPISGATSVVPGQGFGASLAPLGDLDNDGVRDWAAGCRRHPGVPDPGCVRVFSGATATPIQAFLGSIHHDYGWSISSAGDVDGDGTDDLIIGAPQATNVGNPGRGYVELRSAGTGALLIRLDGIEIGAAFGHAVAGLDDLDGDGHPEVFASSPQETTGAGPGAGRTRIFGMGLPPRVITYVSGDHQVASAGSFFRKPIVVQVTTSAGVPVANQEVAFIPSSGIALSPMNLVTTDANGYAQVTAASIPGSDGATKTVRAYTYGGHLAGVEATLFVRWLRIFWLPTAELLVTTFINDNSPIPIMLAVDVPQPPLWTIHGSIYTSIFNPQPTLLVIDGTGVYGSNPTMYASPNWIGIFNVRPEDVLGATTVFQVFGIDVSKPFPENVFLSNPVVINF